jgi:hypothetical protein
MQALSGSCGAATALDGDSSAAATADQYEGVKTALGAMREAANALVHLMLHVLGPAVFNAVLNNVMGVAMNRRRQGAAEAIAQQRDDVMCVFGGLLLQVLFQGGLLML